MTINKLTQLIAKKEGLKQEINIAQIKEILAVLSDIAYESDNSELLCGLSFGSLFFHNGRTRDKRKKK